MILYLLQLIKHLLTNVNVEFLEKCYLIFDRSLNVVVKKINECVSFKYFFLKCFLILDRSLNVVHIILLKNESNNSNFPRYKPLSYMSKNFVVKCAYATVYLVKYASDEI